MCPIENDLSKYLDSLDKDCECECDCNCEADYESAKYDMQEAREDNEND